ncbi:Nucleolar complex protein 4 [Coelomomyces lativittatus]|nr:Nucleolar complex protein 4 [Coelomomyces lativittatus]KAJ1505642.1 Nucleolar complex protein 4 [Coelomomyces lativittatus]KAJ1510069.1 Nucleolar complex protein 4 [Coelomomyces lativittatus]
MNNNHQSTTISKKKSSSSSTTQTQTQTHSFLVKKRKRRHLEIQLEDKKKKTNDIDIQLQQLRTWESNIVSSYLHLNDLTKLLQCLNLPSSSSSSPNKIYTALHALIRLFTLFQKKKYFIKPSLIDIERKNEKEEALLQRYLWFKKQWTCFEDHLCELLFHSLDLTVQHTALKGLCTLLHLKCLQFHALDQRNIIDKDYLQYLLSKMVLSSSQGGVWKHPAWSNAMKNEFFTFLLKYDDLRFYFFKVLTHYFTSNLPSSSSSFQETQEKKDPSSLSSIDITTLLEFTLDLLEHLHPPFLLKEEMDSTTTTGSTPKLTPSLVHRYLIPTIPQDHPVRCGNQHRHVFSDFILTFLQCPSLTQPMYKRILRKMATHLIPYLTDPKCLMTFLVTAFHVGGTTGLLALQSVFLLISKYNLAYPEFYDHLYEFLNPSLLHVKYRAHYFQLLQTFMQSTHLPSYLVASFIKRLARLGLFASPGGLWLVLPTMYNLLSLHPTCQQLLTRQHSVTLDTDPFVLDTPHIASTRAMESGLWELQVLSHHWVPGLASFARQMSLSFSTLVRHKPWYDIHAFSGYTYASLMQEENVDVWLHFPAQGQTTKKRPSLNPNVLHPSGSKHLDWMQWKMGSTMDLSQPGTKKEEGEEVGVKKREKRLFWTLFSEGD